MNILITGINSVLGAQLGISLLKEGHSVYGTYNQNTANIPKEITSFHHTQIPNAGFIPDLLFLIGAYVPRGAYTIHDERFITQTIEPIKQLVSLFPNARFVLASTVSVYGDTSGLINEKSVFTNTSLYGQSKLTAEKIIQGTTSWAVIRFSSIYGKNFGSINFINRAIKQAEESREIVIHGDGSRQQNYIYLADAVNFLKKTAFHDINGVFLGTSPKSHSNKEIADLIATLIENTGIQYEGQDISPSYHYDNSETIKMLNFNSMTTVQKGIEEIIRK